MNYCANCGKENDDRALFCQTCGVKLKHSESAPAGHSFTVSAGVYGGFWMRVGAWAIDWIVVAVGTGLVVALTAGVGFFVIFFGQWLYEAFMHSSSWQATLGKRALNMVVTGMNGERITFARATGRYFAKWISAFLLGVGFVMAAFTEKKQGLHDMIAETLVINRSA